MSRWLSHSTQAFPVWVVAGGILALFQPAWFTWFSGPWIVWGLAVIMLGMGLTLQVDDFKRVARVPRPVGLGLVAQYTIMPALGWSIGRLLNLDTPFAVGLILVACCPGGTASNVVTFIARADVCLSVVMTAVSTVAAVVLTPLLTAWLAGTRVEVDAAGLFQSTLQVVIIPVALGVALNRGWPRLTRKIQPASPLVSVLAIALICASIIGQSAEAVKASAGSLLAAVALLHVGGFALGYGLTRVCGFPTRTARTISIEVGMQNSGLGVVLARRHFAEPLTAVPCAISSVFHSVIGSILAGWWRWWDGAEAGVGTSGALPADRTANTMAR